VLWFSLEDLVGGLGAKRGVMYVGVKGDLSEGVGESLWVLEIQLDDGVAADLMNKQDGRLTRESVSVEDIE
jgi:hypothetical protein